MRVFSHIKKESMRREIVSEQGDDRELNTISDTEDSKGFFSYNSVGNFNFVDENFAALFGYTKKEILSMNFIELVHPDDLEKVLKLYELFVKTGHTPSSMIIKCMRKDKTPLAIEFHSEVVREAGEIKGTKGFVKKLLKNKNTEESSWRSETNIQELTKKVNQLDNGMKRTFTTIRNIILISLSKGQLSINEIATLSGINWKTVENHLTYLIGKKLVRENFSSKYVRLFELTKHGEEYVFNLKEELTNYFIQKSTNEVLR